MSKPDPSDVLVARSADRIAVIAMRGDAEAALQLVKELHDHAGEVKVALRTDNTPPEPRRKTAMPARFPGRCAHCATAIRVGEPIIFDSEARQAVHERCSG